MSRRTIVVKAGTSVLLDSTTTLDRPVVERILNELVDAREAGHHVIFVSSGAIGAGLAPLGLKLRPTNIPDLQACAAVGQSLLMQAYNEILTRRGYVAAQLLLTYDDFQDRRRYLNLRNTLAALQERRAVLPIINENDTVSIDEIKFGDNDTLGALVANVVDAHLTILLSDVDGLYTANPRLNPDATRIDVVEGVSAEIERMADVSDSGLGSGGMTAKLRAARTVTSVGGALVLAGGKTASIAAILRGEIDGTEFRPSGDRLHQRKRWIAHTLKEMGTLDVDAGAARAVVEQGKSLLPVGVTGCDGSFVEGDPVVVKHQGRPIAKGLSNYSSEQIRRIMGKKSSEIASLLGGKIFDEVLHRDNLVRL